MPIESSYPFFLICLIGGIGSSLLAILIISGGAIWWLRQKGRNVVETWQSEGITFLREPTGINFSGLESQGMGQMRGNGVMALTNIDLRLNRALPFAEWRIPHQDITDVQLADSFLGKRWGMPVLIVTFEQDNQVDRIGFYVSDSQTWLEAITNVANLEK